MKIQPQMLLFGACGGENNAIDRLYLNLWTEIEQPRWHHVLEPRESYAKEKGRC